MSGGERTDRLTTHSKVGRGRRGRLGEVGLPEADVSVYRKGVGRVGAPFLARCGCQPQLRNVLEVYEQKRTVVFGRRVPLRAQLEKAPDSASSSAAAASGQQPFFGVKHWNSMPGKLRTSTMRLQLRPWVAHAIWLYRRLEEH